MLEPKALSAQYSDRALSLCQAWCKGLKTQEQRGPEPDFHELPTQRRGETSIQISIELVINTPRNMQSNKGKQWRAIPAG